MASGDTRTNQQYNQLDRHDRISSGGVMVYGNQTNSSGYHYNHAQVAGANLNSDFLTS